MLAGLDALMRLPFRPSEALRASPRGPVPTRRFASRPPRNGTLAFVLPLLAWACSATHEGATFDETESGGGDGGSSADGVAGSTGDIKADAGNGTFDGEACGETTFANQVPSSVLIVLDRSGSMSGGDGAPDKWGPTKAALQAMMAGASPKLEVGLLPFAAGQFNNEQLALCALTPSSPECAALFADGGCQDVSETPAVPVGPLSTTKDAIAAWLAANGPSGGTPTRWALKRAYDILRAYPAKGERYVLLMTDGEPNVHTPAQTIGPISLPESNIECGTLADIEAEALAGAQGSPPVKTFVVGSPGSEGAGSFLSQLAINGQTAKSAGCSAAAADCHYQVGSANFQADLQAVLDEIAGTVSDCVFEVPEGEDVDPNKVNVVVVTPSGTIETFKDPTHQDGWDYTDQSKKKIQLYGPACEAYTSQEGAEVSVVLGCETVVK